MIMRPVRWAVSIFVAFAVAWVMFMVPFGRFTLFQHVSRIWATDEAQELSGEVGEASERLSDEVVRQVSEAAQVDGGLRIRERVEERVSDETRAAQQRLSDEAERRVDEGMRSAEERVREEARAAGQRAADEARAAGQRATESVRAAGERAADTARRATPR